MAKIGIFDYDPTTAVNNSDIASVDISGATGKVKDGDNAIRAEMSHAGAFARDLGGATTTSGTNTVTVTLTQSITAYVTGMTFRVKFGGTNTGAATLNPNSLGAKNVKVNSSSGAKADPVGGQMLTGRYGNFTYDGTDLVLLDPVVVTAWVAYTPTIAGVGTATGVSVWSRRVGDSLELRGTFTTGTVAAATATITLGFNGTNANVSIDTAKIPATGQRVLMGQMAIFAVTAVYNYHLFADAGSVSLLNFGFENGAQSGLTGVLGNAIFASSTQYSFSASGIPISGW